MSDAAIVPKLRPEMGRYAALALLEKHGVKGPAILARRGYYRDAMGQIGVNDIGIYDDAMMIVTPSFFGTFNANCDPSRHKPGIATLKAGVWMYKLGTHNLSKDPKIHPRYTALVQAEPVTVQRWKSDDEAPSEDTGRFGINIHCGGYHTTSSEGCLTIYPDQWQAFIELVQLEVKRHSLVRIPVVMSDRDAVPPSLLGDTT